MPYSRDEVKKEIEEIENLLAESRKVNGDITYVDRIVNLAKQSFEKGEFDETMNYLKEAREKLNEIYVQGAKEQLSFLRAITAAIKNTGIDPKELREFLRNTRTFFENKDYIRAYKTACEGMNFASQLIQNDPVLKQNIYKSRHKFGISETFLEKIEKKEEKQRVEIPERTERVYIFETKLKMAKDAGIEISAMEGELAALDKAISACQEKLNELVSAKVREKIEALRKRIEEFKMEGIETERIEQMLTALAEREEELSLEETFGEIKSIEEALQHPDLYITALKKRIQMLKDLNLDAKEFDNALAQAQLFRTDGNLSSASAIAREAYRKIGEFIAEKMKEIIENIQNLVDYGVNNRVKGITKDLLAGLVENYRAGNYAGCAEILKEVNIKVENAFKEHLKDKISALNVRMNVAKNMGVALPGIENSLQNVREKISAKDYLGAIKLLDEIEGRCEMEMQRYREINDLLGEFDKKMQALMALGVDVVDAQEIFSKVIELKNVHIEEAIKAAKSGIAKLEEKIKGIKFGLDLEFKNEPAEKGAEAEAELGLKNVGNVNLKEVRIECNLPVSGLKEHIPLLKVGAREVIKFKIKAGEEKVSFKVRAQNPLSPEPFSLSKEFSIVLKEEKKPEVVKEEAVKEEARGFIKKTADGIYQCLFCRGKIKQGLPMVVCACGATYHEPCANRAGLCLKCKNPIK